MAFLFQIKKLIINYIVFFLRKNRLCSTCFKIGKLSQAPRFNHLLLYHKFENNGSR